MIIFFLSKKMVLYKENTRSQGIQIIKEPICQLLLVNSQRNTFVQLISQFIKGKKKELSLKLLLNKQTERIKLMLISLKLLIKKI